MLVSPATSVALMARITFIEASIPGKPILLIRLFRLQPASIKRAGKTLNREAKEESGFGRFRALPRLNLIGSCVFFGGGGRTQSTPLLRRDFATSSLKLSRLCGNSFNNNEQNIFFFLSLQEWVTGANHWFNKQRWSATCFWSFPIGCNLRPISFNVVWAARWPLGLLHSEEL